MDSFSCKIIEGGGGNIIMLHNCSEQNNCCECLWVGDTLDGVPGEG